MRVLFGPQNEPVTDPITVTLKRPPEDPSINPRSAPGQLLEGSPEPDMRWPAIAGPSLVKDIAGSPPTIPEGVHQCGKQDGQIRASLVGRAGRIIGGAFDVGHPGAQEGIPHDAAPRFEAALGAAVRSGAPGQGMSPENGQRA